jgi:hypothetical protein
MFGFAMISLMYVSNRSWRWAGFMMTAVSAPLPEPAMEMTSRSIGISPESATMAAHSTTTFVPWPNILRVWGHDVDGADGVELLTDSPADPSEGVAGREDLAAAGLDLLAVLF